MSDIYNEHLNSQLLNAAAGAWPTAESDPVMRMVVGLRVTTVVLLHGCTQQVTYAFMQNANK